MPALLSKKKEAFFIPSANLPSGSAPDAALAILEKSKLTCALNAVSSAAINSLRWGILASSVNENHWPSLARPRSAADTEDRDLERVKLPRVTAQRDRKCGSETSPSTKSKRLRARSKN